MSQNIIPHESDFLLYTSPDGEVRVEVLVQDETIWLSQKRMAELFGVDVRTVNEHLQNIFKSSELNQDWVIRKIRITADDGKNYETNFYNLDAIISVGYRVNSARATRFRQWATQRLREYIVKGFTIDTERLKQGEIFGKDYFEELLEKIREIRSSERRFYQKITDIYATSADYDPHAEITQTFFATVQNKLHFAIHGKTASELIAERSDAEKPNMGSRPGRTVRMEKYLKQMFLLQKTISQKKNSKSLNESWLCISIMPSSKQSAV